MSEIQQLFQQMPIDQIARQAGVSDSEAREAVQAILPALVGGMQANAQDPSGAASLEQALGQHQGLFDRRVGGDVDTADGQKIVQHVFGSNTDQIATALGGQSGALGGIIQKILPIVAPIVIAWIANKYFGQGGAQQTQSRTEAPQAPQGGNPFEQSRTNGPAGNPSVPNAPASDQQAPTGGLGDLLGGILGGSGSGARGSGSIFGDLLGGLLGGGRR